jgi:hypothetical protein
MPWDEAEMLLSPRASDRAGIKKWHATLQDRDQVGTSIAFVQKCPDPNHWQVGVEIDGAPTMPDLDRLYFDIVANPDYRIRSIAVSRPPRCPGETAPPAVSFELDDQG